MPPLFNVVINSHQASGASEMTLKQNYTSRNPLTKLLETGIILSQSDRVSSNPCALPEASTIASRFTKKERWHFTMAFPSALSKILFKVALSVCSINRPSELTYPIFT